MLKVDDLAKSHQTDGTVKKLQMQVEDPVSSGARELACRKTGLAISPLKSGICERRTWKTVGMIHPLKSALAVARASIEQGEDEAQRRSQDPVLAGRWTFNEAVKVNLLPGP